MEANNNKNSNNEATSDTYDNYGELPRIIVDGN